MDSFPLLIRQLNSLDFVVVRMGMKLFHSTNRDFVVTEFNRYGFVLPSVEAYFRLMKFVRKFEFCENLLCAGIVNSSLALFP